MTSLSTPLFKAVFDSSVVRASFSMPQLYAALAQAGAVWRDQQPLLFIILNERTAVHVIQSLLRSSFLIEAVVVRGGATKMTVRWASHLTQDIRYATFEDCANIFEALMTQLSAALETPNIAALLTGFAAHKRVSFEIPVDYRQSPLQSPIHRQENIQWDWSPLAFRVIQQRHLLRTTSHNPYAALFGEVYKKIATKTYLTDRAQTGSHQTNREKRWEAHPGSFQYALRRHCWGVEAALINQIAHFAGFPPDLFQRLNQAGALDPVPTPYRCPITLEPLSFTDFENEIRQPRHGHARFQVGHLNPLRGLAAAAEGHTAANIGWVTADGNRIQGHLSLGETRALLKRISENYRQHDPF